MAKLFSFTCSWTKTESRSINTQKKKKKNEANIQPSNPKTWTIEDALYGIKNNFFLRETARKEISAQELILAS